MTSKVFVPVVSKIPRGIFVSQIVSGKPKVFKLTKSKSRIIEATTSCGDCGRDSFWHIKAKRPPRLATYAKVKCQRCGFGERQLVHIIQSYG